MNKIIYKLTLALLAAVLLPSTVWADDNEGDVPSVLPDGPTESNTVFFFGDDVLTYNASATTTAKTSIAEVSGQKMIKIFSAINGWKYIGFNKTIDLRSYKYLHLIVYRAGGVDNGTVKIKTRLNNNGSSGKENTWNNKAWAYLKVDLDDYKVPNTTTIYDRKSVSAIGLNLSSGGSAVLNLYIACVYASKSAQILDANGDPIDMTEESLAAVQDATVSGKLGSDAITLLNNANLASIDVTSATNVTGLTPKWTNCLVYAAEDLSLTKNQIVSGTCDNLQLTDDTQHAFSAPSAFTATVAQLKRTFSAAGIYSFVAPFDVTDIPAGITARQFVGIGEGKVTFAKIDALTANQPYLIEVESSGEYTFEASSVSVPVTNPGESAAVDGYVFTAVMTPTAAGEITGSYVLDADGSGFVKAKATTRVGSMRAYLQGSGGEARLVIFYDDGQTTGINGTGRADADSCEVFDLQGRAVGNVPLTKGVCIKNGKKVVVK